MRISDKEFELYISSEDIQKRIREIGHEINNDYSNKVPLFIGVLNGAFMFAADIFKQQQINFTILIMSP